MPRKRELPVVFLFWCECHSDSKSLYCVSNRTSIRYVSERFTFQASPARCGTRKSARAPRHQDRERPPLSPPRAIRRHLADTSGRECDGPAGRGCVRKNIRSQDAKVVEKQTAQRGGVHRRRHGEDENHLVQPAVSCEDAPRGCVREACGESRRHRRETVPCKSRD